MGDLRRISDQEIRDLAARNGGRDRRPGVPSEEWELVEESSRGPNEGCDEEEAKAAGGPAPRNVKQKLALCLI